MSMSLTNDYIKALIEARPRDDVPWLDALRGDARSRFKGLPTRRLEAWKYSDLARALEEAPQGAETPRPLLSSLNATRLTFRDGVIDALPDGILSLRSTLADPLSPFANIIGKINPLPDSPLFQLNTALMEDGIVLHVPRGVALATPLQLQFDWTGIGDGHHHLRCVIVLEDGASLSLLETHDGAPGFATIVSEVRLGARAQFNHVRIERLAPSARQAALTLGDLGPEACYKGFYSSEGGSFCRHEAHLRLGGDGARAEIDGAYLVAESRHCDNTTVIAHAARNTLSRQTFRGVLTGRARGVYQGCVRVRPGAQGTDARQISRALLLSHKAEIATKPELEILADDVKCAHGATAGEIDQGALFFLRARGIPEGEARALLVSAFLSEAFAAIADEGIRGLAETALGAWLVRHASEVAHVD